MLANLAADTGKTVDEIQQKGGVFADPGTEYTGNQLANKHAKELRIYFEELATTIDSMTGRYFDPLPTYEPPAHLDGTSLDTTDGSYAFRLITQKTVRHGQARTATNPWLMALQPENFVDLSSADAAALGVTSGDKVKVSSPSNPEGIVGKAWVTEGLMPGVVAVSHSFGHWELGARPHVIDGVAQS